MIPIPGDKYFKLSSIGYPEHSKELRWQQCHNCYQRFPLLPKQDYIAACNGNGKHETRIRDGQVAW